MGDRRSAAAPQRAAARACRAVGIAAFARRANCRFVFDKRRKWWELSRWRRYQACERYAVIWAGGGTQAAWRIVTSILIWKLMLDMAHAGRRDEGGHGAPGARGGAALARRQNYRRVALASRRIFFFRASRKRASRRLITRQRQSNVGLTPGLPEQETRE